MLNKYPICLEIFPNKQPIAECNQSIFIKARMQIVYVIAWLISKLFLSWWNISFVHIFSNLIEWSMISFVNPIIMWYLSWNLVFVCILWIPFPHIDFYIPINSQCIVQYCQANPQSTSFFIYYLLDDKSKIIE